MQSSSRKLGSVDHSIERCCIDYSRDNQTPDVCGQSVELGTNPIEVPCIGVVLTVSIAKQERWFKVVSSTSTVHRCCTILALPKSPKTKQSAKFMSTRPVSTSPRSFIQCQGAQHMQNTL